MITLEMARNGKRIYARTNRPISLKDIPGASLNDRYGKPYWSLPLSMPVCRRLREEFGAELEIGPALREWAKAENRKAAQMKALSESHDADLQRVPQIAPRLGRAMGSRTYQRVGARFVAEARANGAGCLVADQPGLGKTLEALGGVVESGVPGPYLVVTPKTSVTPVWAREIPRWLDGQTVVTLPEGDKQAGRKVTKQRQRRDAVLDVLASSPNLATTWLIVHPEAVRTQVWWVCGACGEETRRKAGKVQLKCGCDPDLRHPDRVEHEYPQLFRHQWGAVIVDESDRSLLRLNGTPTQARQGMEMIPVRPEGLRVAMTGTPTRGRPHLLWGQLNWIDPKAFSSFWNWTGLFWEISSNGFSNHVIGKLAREEELWRSLDRYVLRRTKAEVAKDMPAKTYVGTPAIEDDETSPIGVWLPMEGVQAKQYKEMLATSTADLEDGSRVEAIGILAELMRLKQFAGASGRVETTIRNVKCKDESCPDGPEAHKHQQAVQQFYPELPSNKFEYLVQLLDELGFPDSPTTKVVVVSQFTEMLDLFARELPARLQALSIHPKTALRPEMIPVLLTGEQTGKRRDMAIEAMNEPVGSGAHIMLLQTKTGGVAITLDQADVMVFLDETWVPDDQEQAEDRIHRVSRPRPVFYHYLRSLDSIDLGIALTNAEREDSTKRLLDGRRGVEYTRAVLRLTREIQDGVVASTGGNAPHRGSDVPAGSSGGARATRTLERHPGGGANGASEARRRDVETTADQSLAPNPASRVQRKPPTKRGPAVAKQMSDEQIAAYKNKPQTDVTTRFGDWLIDKLDLEFKTGKDEALFREAVRLATALRSVFQASPENQEVRAEARAEREEATETPKPAKKSAKAAKPAVDEEDEEEAPAPKASKPAKKAAKATKAAKPAPADEDEDEDEDEAPAAPAAKKSAPRKASARSSAAAPF